LVLDVTLIVSLNFLLLVGRRDGAAENGSLATSHSRRAKERTGGLDLTFAPRAARGFVKRMSNPQPHQDLVVAGDLSESDHQRLMCRRVAGLAHQRTCSRF
jgi:hypothetical protein